jgi:hypothetical protein
MEGIYRFDAMTLLIVTFVDSTYATLHTGSGSGFSEKLSWALVTRLLFRVFMYTDMSKVCDGGWSSLSRDG